MWVRVGVQVRVRVTVRARVQERVRKTVLIILTNSHKKTAHLQLSPVEYVLVVLVDRLNRHLVRLRGLGFDGPQLRPRVGRHIVDLGQADGAVGQGGLDRVEVLWGK